MQALSMYSFALSQDIMHLKIIAYHAARARPTCHPLCCPRLGVACIVENVISISAGIPGVSAGWSNLSAENSATPGKLLTRHGPPIPLPPPPPPPGGQFIEQLTSFFLSDFSGALSLGCSLGVQCER